MIKKVLIFGSGSIGNHLANACRQLNMSVSVTDISSKALLRMKNKIYPLRYKKWDKKIALIDYKKVFKLKQKFDLILIGTPPLTHISLLEQISNNLICDKIMIEKPLATYKVKLNINKINKLTHNKKLFIGYNHSISESFSYYKKLIGNIKIAEIKLVEVNWREGWRGILNAHFWNKDEFSTYLGNLSLGGGCTHEHSHGIHLLICLEKILNFKIKSTKFKFINLVNKNKDTYYDNYICAKWKYKNFFISYTSDLIYEPAKKSICIYTKKKNFELVFNYKKRYDLIRITDLKSNLIKLKYFPKSRSTDFVREINHIINIKTKKNYEKSFINFEKGIKTQKIINSTLNNV